MWGFYYQCSRHGGQGGELDEAISTRLRALLPTSDTLLAEGDNKGNFRKACEWRRGGRKEDGASASPAYA